MAESTGDATMSAGDRADAKAALSHYPAVAGLRWVPLGPGGGFSGAAVWRGEADGRPAFALKAWPAGYPAGRLAAVHRWMGQAAVPFVPAVVRTAGGASLVEYAGRVWDVTAWMFGDPADGRPSEARLAAACAALAELHRRWAPVAPVSAPCPGVLRRLALLESFRASPPPPSPDPLIRRAVDLLAARIPSAVAALRPWADRPLPIQPCLCDVWRAHVLFTGDRVTGIIDYGAMKPDHPAVDMARLLGDYLGDDRPAREFALAAYRTAGGPVPVDPEFVALLDRTGVVCAVIHWVRQMAGSSVADPVKVRRLGELVERLAGLSDRLIPGGG